MPRKDTTLQPKPAPGHLEVITAEECVRRLKLNDIGRVGLVDRDVHPLIFPVNYFFEGNVVAFRTGPGSKLDLAPGSPVCFEIDGWDALSEIGWSILVKGIAHDQTNPRGAPSGSVRLWPVHPLAPGSRENWIAITAEEISGRWFRKALKANGTRS